MKKLILLAAFGMTFSAHAQQYWQQELHYRLQASLNEAAGSLDAFMTLQYTNHSPDTLHFIWFHLWPNAFRNDRTSYTEQAIENGHLDFYFSSKEAKGYINRLDFRVNGSPAKTEDHPEYQDIVKLVLPDPLLPGASVSISTAFYEKLPYDFSGTGYSSQDFQVCNWYPEPAVYDQTGWHPMPFLEQGGAYHEFANYDVTLTLPDKYNMVASGGDAISTEKINAKKIWHLSQTNANAFAWIASRTMRMRSDTIILHSGRVVQARIYYKRKDSIPWKHALQNIKRILQEGDACLGEYPYDCLSIAETGIPSPDAACYGGLSFGTGNAIAFATWNNLLSSMTETDNRKYPWLTKGLANYYYRRFETGKDLSKENLFRLEKENALLSFIESQKLGQPVNTPSPDFSFINYTVIPSVKAAVWFQQLENSLGRSTVDTGIRQYFAAGKFRHSDSADLQAALENAAGKKLETHFERLGKTGVLYSGNKKWGFRLPSSQPDFHNERKNLITIAPVPGYNMYDHFSLGLLFTNYNIPVHRFQFYFAPMIAFGSKKLNGVAGINYSWYPAGRFQKITAGFNYTQFSINAATDTPGNKLFSRVHKGVPYIRLDFRNNNPRSTKAQWIDARTFLIGESFFTDYSSSSDGRNHPNGLRNTNRYLNQLSYTIEDYRALYPYQASLQMQQSDLFYRVNLTAGYFLNYAKDGGLNVRLFASKFGAWKNNNNLDLARYEPKLLGNTGEEDYTYSNYFIGRTASYAIDNPSVSNGGIAAQQIMIRDGGLKMRIDQYDFLQGRSSNWVAALNISSSLPQHLFPFKIPFKLFFDVGTYAEAWQTNPETSRFLFVGGIQLSLFRNLLNIYAPLIYSSDFRDQLKTLPSQNSFGKKITFSIDIQNLDRKKIFREIATH